MGAPFVLYWEKMHEGVFAMLNQFDEIFDINGDGMLNPAEQTLAFLAVDALMTNEDADSEDDE